MIGIQKHAGKVGKIFDYITASGAAQIQSFCGGRMQVRGMFFPSLLLPTGTPSHYDHMPGAVGTSTTSLLCAMSLCYLALVQQSTARRRQVCTIAMALPLAMAPYRTQNAPPTHSCAVLFSYPGPSFHRIFFCRRSRRKIWRIRMQFVRYLLHIQSFLSR